MAMKKTRKPLNCQQLPSQPTWDPRTHPTPVPALMICLWFVRIVSWWADETSGPETCTKDVNQRVSVLRIQGQMQHSRQVIQVRKFIKVKAQSQDVRMGKFKTAAVNGVWVILLTGVNKMVEYSLPGPTFSWKQSFVPLLIWSRVSCHGTHHLRAVGFDPASRGVLPGQASDFPNSWLWLPLCWPPGILLEPN